MAYSKEDLFDLQKDKLDRILTIPNLICVARILWSIEFANRTSANGVIPILSAEEAGLIGLSDAADGYIARNYDQKSNLGKLLDPLSDRCYAISMIYTLLKTGQIPLEWQSVGPLSAIAARDILLNIAGLVYISKNNVSMAKESNVFGKVKTGLLTASILSAFQFGFGNEGAELIAPVSLGLAAATIPPEIAYILKNLRKESKNGENSEIDSCSIDAFEEKWAQEDKSKQEQGNNKVLAKQSIMV